LQGIYIGSRTSVAGLLVLPEKVMYKLLLTVKKDRCTEISALTSDNIHVQSLKSK
jgi:hypothetical protein